MPKDVKTLIREEWVKCAKDPTYFFKKYCYIQHPHRGKILFNLYPFQEDLMDNVSNNRFNVILKSRQLGISTMSAGYSLWLMLFHEDKNILVIATKQEVAKNLVTKVRFMHDNLPSWLKGQTEEDNKLSLRLRNGSQIKATSAAGDAGRSEALSMLIIDEAAFINNVEEIWTSAQSTLSTGGGAIVLSTPNGVGNWFISSGHTVVEGATLQWYEETYIKDPIEKRGFDGNYWLWDYPNYSRDYVVVADVARGDSSDYSAFHVFDVETVEQVAEYKGKIDTKQYGAMLTSVATDWNNAMLVIENANIGWAVIQEVIDRNYANLYYSYRDVGYIDDDIHLRKGVDLKRKEDMVPGFSMTSRTRPLVISKLDMYMRERTPIIRSKRLIEELFVFIWNGSRAEAQRGYNDDLVISFSTGLWVRDTALKLRQQGIDLTRTTLGHIGKSSTGVYSNRQLGQDPWKQKDQRGNENDLTWLL